MRTVNINEKYVLYEDGRVWSNWTNRFLKPTKRGNYLCYDLTLESKKAKKYNIHRLLAEHFIPNPDNYPVVRHLNDNKLDNRLENLAWGTYSDNSNDCKLNGNYKVVRHDAHGMRVIDSKIAAEVKSLLASGMTQMQIVRKLKLTRSIVGHIKYGNSWRDI